MISLEALLERVGSGDRAAAARAITLASGAAGAARIAAWLAARPRRAQRIGVTGPPGVGKSTLIGALVPLLRARGEQVAVVACDPRSPLSGGAFLGDRMRMAVQAGDDPGVFIRSLSSAEPGSALPAAALLAAGILGEAGFERVILETPGAGQNDTGLRGQVETVVLVLSPEAGDEFQLLKAGLLETADILVVNRAERPGAEALLGQLREEAEARLRSGRPAPPVLATVAVRGEGVEGLVQALDGARRASPAGAPAPPTIVAGSGDRAAGAPGARSRR